MFSLPAAPIRGLVGAALFASVLVLLYTRLFRKKPPYPLPPGPPRKFLVGNLGQLSVDHPEEDYIRWGKEYKSDVVYTNVLGQHMISLNSVKAATDLLDRRGANYCDRPRFTLFEVMGWGLTLTFLRWGPRFKLHRRLFQNTFTQSNVKIFRPIQLHECRKAVRSLIRDPADWEKITLLLTTSIIFRIAFGQEITDKDSPYCAMSEAANEATTNGGIAGATLVDIFPLARFIPSWLNPSAPLRHARASRTAIQRIHNEPWEANMKDIEAGNAAPSFMQTQWEKYKENEKAGRAQEMTIADIKGATGAAFIAGGNSTWGTILANMLFLTKYPEIQKKVHAELDALLAADGNSRLPDFEDRDQLRCLDNFMMETMRCLPLNPLVIPHKSLKDDIYEGMFIPAGTTVFANATAITTNPDTYAEPLKFDPERYDRGEPYPSGNFGFGRRKCPGNWLALASVYMFLATFLATFELEQVIGEDGKPIVPKPGVSIGLGGHPASFKCKLKLRNPEMAKLIAQEP
ncbi:cytochrome p450 monooxygenase [Truncatella angustata]|uniref:Cytochrome p450 monooxygenase n=1 Tax=Truncatella angustata TaxID=152316 RepID=A0A9P8UGS6_9PEZI|nr:cytochrome p450 monooxygenase [Truncatella angustata]KAH6651823.1 cytochrome p450 monooxygenase [Truncatella angustata]